MSFSDDRTCLLHIGAPKTGSTAIQAFLEANRPALEGHGWRYPDVSLRGFGHHDLAFLVSGGYPDWATPQDRPLPDLLRDLARHTAAPGNLILSSENFYLLADARRTAEALEAAGAPRAAVRILVYVRRQDDAHIAWYNQIVKAQGYSGTIGDSISDSRELWDYAARLEPWREVFGAERMFVRLYPDPASGGDIRCDLLDLLGLPQAGFRFAAAAENARLNTDILEFQRIVNTLPLSPQEKRRFHKSLIELSTRSAGGSLFEDAPLLSADEREALMEPYRDGNERLARTYGVRIPDATADGPDGGAGAARHRGSRLTMEKLAGILGWLMARPDVHEGR